MTHQSIFFFMACLFYVIELMEYHSKGGEPSVSMEGALVLNGAERSRMDL